MLGEDALILKGKLILPPKKVEVFVTVMKLLNQRWFSSYNFWSWFWTF